MNINIGDSLDGDQNINIIHEEARNDSKKFHSPLKVGKERRYRRGKGRRLHPALWAVNTAARSHGGGSKQSLSFGKNSARQTTQSKGRLLPRITDQDVEKEGEGVNMAPRWGTGDEGGSKRSLLSSHDVVGGRIARSGACGGQWGGDNQGWKRREKRR
ncbi:hypothetical protein ZIOFF_019951 [Zingiber officinale]|uniref:Uncharacterized protein n=1 Tax=Zingiber officinale TaxID=94328 RepID=A0A8J5LJT9_ZINOF|nr:hypothetical protein ZIOFF_019951 [Zingiber officinale]